jgi:uncharacterized protein (TIGR02147 family)
LGLTGAERVFLESWVKRERSGGAKRAGASREITAVPTKPRRRSPAQNHLLSHWLNVYLRDAAKLDSFTPDPIQLSCLLNGIATPRQIERSLRFLLHEGFLRRTLDGRIVQNEVLVTSSDGVPNSKVRDFHKRALTIARRNLDLLPVEERKEAALIVHLNPDSVAELRQLMTEFYERLLQFADERPGEHSGLYQVLLNFTPIVRTEDRR